EVVVERVEKLEGQVISRTYTIYWQWDNPTNDPYAETTVIRCSDLTAPPATPALFAAMLEAIMLDPLGSEHLVRHEKRHQREDYTGDWWMDGRPHTVLEEDGTVSRYEYIEDLLGNNDLLDPVIEESNEEGTVTTVHTGPL